MASCDISGSDDDVSIAWGRFFARGKARDAG